mmetsp:Transcript_39688/g.86434  ORF Transcript_39688/g.86434 Transcript_39688/m.86434 type:complete len:458 (-) Transcript_39688:321-1694(-)|eukprot:CAMPEP_0118928568 /NCGR_PEP_ID=MMETSP1169-20130426/5797_1 /TAXON_ID=36882 /ORGANISM="Pyramimonas obovata, Strain CCMP722" /LENGTH=457 /DNA_ID=CAMNT_0006870587 /DNA_START=195 /DNA_END=1568 /DNA_ORIENTATION=-
MSSFPDLVALGNGEVASIKSSNLGSSAKNTWSVKVNTRALEIVNPIRQVIEQMGRPNPNKEPISLAQGDPSVYGNLNVSEQAVRAVVEATTSGKANGYSHSCGLEACRAAVAASHSPSNNPIEARHVFMTSGCSGALDKVVAVLATPGSNLLIPAPGFALYETLCDYHGVEARGYRLDPQRQWEADMEALEALIDDHTSALLVCNPGNPTGSNYSREHLEELAALAERKRILLVADEVYAGMVFEGERFVAMAEVSARAPVLTVGAVSKRWLAPGWRCGWIVAHDRDGILADAGVLEALGRLQQITLGPCNLIQAAIPAILAATDASWTTGVMRKLAANAEACVRRIKQTPGISVAGLPQGAMYLMVQVHLDRFQSVQDDVDFSRALQEEESVVVLPGRCFQAPGFFRICFAAPVPVLDAAFDRIHSFCVRHTDGQEPSTPPSTSQVGHGAELTASA